MRLGILPLAALACFALGCNKSPESGSAGTHDSFTISAPTIPTTIKQDNKESVKLSLSRGSDFKKDVKLSVAPVLMDGDPTVTAKLTEVDPAVAFNTCAPTVVFGIMTL